MKILVFFTVIPLLAAFLSALSGSLMKKHINLIANCASLLLFVLSMKVAQLVLSYKVIVYKMSGWNFPLGILLVADGLSVFLLVIVNLICFLISVYSISFMHNYTVNGSSILFLC